MSQSIKIINDDNFETEVIQSRVPVLVDFFADWCGPCKMVAPVIEALAPAYEGRVQFVKVNVDKSPETAEKYGIRGIPTLLLFKEGEVGATKVGALTQSQLISFIDSNI